MTPNESNICKGIAIIMMFVHHLFYDRDRYAGFNVVFWGGEELTLIIAQLCKVCVAVFVFLSAYGMTKTFNRNNISQFCIRRYIKLLFLFWFAYFVSALSTFVFDGRNLAEAYGNDGALLMNYLITDMMGVAQMFGFPTLNPTWWYMSFAILLIFLYPAFYYAYEKMGKMMLILAVFFPSLIQLNQDLSMRGTLSWYFLGIVLGIVSAKENWFEKIKTSKNVKIISILCIFVVPVLFYVKYLRLCRTFIIDNVLAFAICLFVTLIIGKIIVLRDVLGFLGVHSANMFLLHTFVFKYYFHDFIYSDGWAFGILLRLTIVMLVISVVLEFSKKLIRYKNLEKLVLNKIAF